MTTLIPGKPRTPDSEYERVLRLISEGVTCAEIADQTHVSERTVKNRVQTLRERFGARNTPHLITLAHRAGLLGTADVGPEHLVRRLGELLGIPVVVPGPTPIREDQR